MLPGMTERTLADQLLDAQVAFVLDQLTGEGLADLLERDVDDLLAIGREIRLDALVDAAEVKRIVRRLLATVPPSTAASTLVEAGADVAYAGPPEPFTVGELLAREHVELLLDEALALQPVVQQVLDRVTESPLIASVASRFVARIVGDVLATNRAVAEKIPGVGSLVSFGAGAASKVMGASGAGIEQLLGDTAGKGAQLAVRRLNKIVADTMKDPMLRDALLQVWDEHSSEEVLGLRRIAKQDDVRRVAGILQEVVIAAAPAEPVGALVEALVDAFFEQYGEHPVTTLVEELDLARDDLVEDLRSLAPAVIAAAVEGGRLEKLVRDRLEPFYRSEAFAAIVNG